MKFENRNTFLFDGEKKYNKMTRRYYFERNKALDMIEAGTYDLNVSDFWVQAATNDKGEKVCNNLIISHTGCQKIAERLPEEHRIDPKLFKVNESGYNMSLVFTYVDDDVYAVGEVNPGNMSIAYPYAIAYKRCFDRAVLAKANMSQHGIYSEVEAEEFANTSVSSQNMSDCVLEAENSNPMNTAIKEEETAKTEVNPPVTKVVEPKVAANPAQKAEQPTIVANPAPKVEAASAPVAPVSETPEVKPEVPAPAKPSVIAEEVKQSVVTTATVTTPQAAKAKVALDEALATVMQRGIMQGRTIQELIDSVNAKRGTKMLTALANNAENEPDGIAARVVLESIASGEVSFKS